MANFTKAQYNKFLEFVKSNDPVLYPIVLKHGYLQPVPKRNIYATLIGSVIGQKIRFTLARSLRGKLYTLLGTDDFYPCDIEKCTDDHLTEIGLSKRTIEIIKNINTFLKQEKLFDNVDNLETQTHKLFSVSGVGSWTISCTNIMHSLHTNIFDVDTLLISDLIIRRAIKSLYHLENKQEIIELSNKWKPWRSIVTWYLWKEYTF